MSEDTPAQPPAQQPEEQQQQEEAAAGSQAEGEKAEEPPPQQQEEEVKSKPAPTPAPAPAPAPTPAPEFNVVKQAFVQRQGQLWKKWNRQWMTLDEGGEALRWYKTEQRTGNDGTFYMSKCAEVCDPKEGLTTDWPQGMDGRCFVVCSPNRAYYIIAESEEDKKEWIEKLTEAKNKFNTTGAKIVSVNLLSVEALKVTLTSEMERAQGETDRALASQGTSTQQVGKDLDKAAQDVEKEVKKETVTEQQQSEVVVEKVEAEVKIEAVGGEEVKVEKTEEVTMQVETATGDGGEVTSEVQVTSEEVTSEVQVTSEEGGGEVQVTSEVATEEQKEDQPPAAEDATKEE